MSEIIEKSIAEDFGFIDTNNLINPINNTHENKQIQPSVPWYVRFVTQMNHDKLKDYVLFLFNRAKIVGTENNKKIILSFITFVVIVFLKKLIQRFGLVNGIRKYIKWIKIVKKNQSPKTINDLEIKFFQRHVPITLSPTLTIAIRFIDDRLNTVDYVNRERLNEFWDIINNNVVLRVSGKNEKCPRFKNGTMVKKISIIKPEQETISKKQPLESSSSSSPHTLDIITSLTLDLKKHNFIPPNTITKGILAGKKFVIFDADVKNNIIYPRLNILVIS